MPGLGFWFDVDAVVPGAGGCAVAALFKAVPAGALAAVLDDVILPTDASVGAKLAADPVVPGEASVVDGTVAGVSPKFAPAGPENAWAFDPEVAEDSPETDSDTVANAPKFDEASGAAGGVVA